MTTTSTIALALASFTCACHFDPVGESVDADSSSSTDEGTDTFVTTVSASATASATSSPSTTTSTSESGTDDSTTDDPTFGDDATTTHGSDSTGEGVTDWALAFDGSSYARKIDDGDVPWSSADFTVETWAQIQDTGATGIILDSATMDFTSGWVLYLHNESHTLVFSFFDENHQNQVVMGPTVESIGTGWHHLAGTKIGDTVFIHVDGITVTTQTVASTLAFDSSTLWSIGGSPDDNIDFRLKDVALDDLRVSAFARYDADFDPPVEYDPASPSVLLLTLDEGDGFLLGDEKSGISFGINDPVWIPGHE